jgi:hypothetical protein
VGRADLSLPAPAVLRLLEKEQTRFWGRLRFYFSLNPAGIWIYMIERDDCARLRLLPTTTDRLRRGYVIIGVDR